MNRYIRRLKAVFGMMVFLGCFSSEIQGAKQTPQQQTQTWLGQISLPGKNYIQDGSFEYGERWMWFMHKAGGLDDKVVYSGKFSFRMGENDPTKYFYYHQYNVPLQTGKTYTLSAMIKTDNVTVWPSDGTPGVIFLTNHSWTKSVALKPAQATTDWTRISKTFVAMPTQPRNDGKPNYTLTIYWPPNNNGRVWFDEIQIEEGDKATAFTDVYVGDALTALEKLQDLILQIFATQEALANFPSSPLITSASTELETTLTQAGKVRDDLKRFAALSKSDREELSKRIDTLASRLAGVRTVMWMGPAHITLNEVKMPASRSEKLDITLTCLKGEHRDIALNIANLTSTGYPARLAVSELYNEARAERILPPQWIKLYSVPAMRGFSKPGEVFTDALPELGKGQIIQVNPATISQAVLSIDTTGLLPGEYTGSITVISMVDAAGKTQIPIKVKVLPVAILPLDKIDIAECYGHEEYAWDAMVELGVNAFDIASACIDSEFNDDGSIKYIDFTRVDQIIRRALTDVPEARFHCISGQGIFSHLTYRQGWKWTEPRFKIAFKAWVKALADQLAALNVGPSRLIIETYDEPGEGDYPTGTSMANWIREVNPAIRSWFYATGIPQDEGWKKNALAHDIIGPGVGLCTPSNMAFAKTLGRQLWVYDCQADGESFEPIAYYRLMPWTCRKYGITGWGHFSWFSSSHGFGRGYRPWQGVETQNLVYPGPGNEGYVISRRFLAIRAGHEDYQVLDALERTMADAKKFLEESYDQALSLSPRESSYQTHLAKGASPDLLDQLRSKAVTMIESVLSSPNELDSTLTEQDNKTTLSVTVPQDGKITVRYLVDGQLPWRVRSQKVSAGKIEIPLTGTGEVNRCLVSLTCKSGQVRVGLPLIIPRISVDITHKNYTPRPLNDGLRVESVKFEERVAWISGPTAVEHWVQMDLGQPRQVSQVNLFWMTHTGLPQKTMIQYADETGTWKPVSATPDFRAAEAPVEQIKFTPVTTGKLRILMAPNGGGKGAPVLMGLSEVEVR
ncbi:MAG: discoidin domain-containing protein [Phycisphaerae bacterium]